MSELQGRNFYFSCSAIEDYFQLINITHVPKKRNIFWEMLLVGAGDVRLRFERPETAAGE
jgi:hypothetical protein